MGGVGFALELVATDWVVRTGSRFEIGFVLVVVRLFDWSRRWFEKMRKVGAHRLFEVLWWPLWRRCS